MEPSYLSAYHNALEDFRDARKAAIISSLLAALRGRDNRLFSFEEVRKKLKLETTSNKTYLADIPVDRIIGSVNRYQDFTRSYLPKKSHTAERWARISAAVKQLESIPPIDVFKVGDVYFVNDGNHRVSVARQMGNTTIQAYVTEIKTRVPLEPDEHPDDLIIKAELADFLEQTRLDILRPGADFDATAPEAYGKLLEHIAIHNYYMNVDQQRAVPAEEATLDWFDTHFLPTTDLIRDTGLLREFPGKTLADLYIWLIDHKTFLEKWLGKEIDIPEAVHDLINRHGSGIESIASRLKDAVLPDGIEGQLPSYATSTNLRNQRNTGQLFSDILVPVSGESDRWYAMEQAVIIAKLEGARLYGLHVTPSPESPASAEMSTRFTSYCHENNVSGKLNFAQGDIQRIISRQSAWQDLVVIKITYRPEDSPISRMTHGLRVILQRTPCPVLAVPRVISNLKHAVLAYDGSQGAQEALFIAAYIGGRWGTHISILTVHDKNRGLDSSVGQDALDYLNAQGLGADLVISTGPVSLGILNAAKEIGADLIIMGGFSRSPLLGVLLDTVTDQVLRESHIPMLMCR